MSFLIAQLPPEEGSLNHNVWITVVALNERPKPNCCVIMRFSPRLWITLALHCPSLRGVCHTTASDFLPVSFFSESINFERDKGVAPYYAKKYFFP